MSATAGAPPGESAGNAPQPWAPVAAFVACAAVWGSTFLVISIGNDSLPPLWAASLRLTIAGTVLTTIVLARGQRLPSGAALRAAAQFGFLNLGLSFSLLYWGETRVASGMTAVVFGTIPLTTAVFARVFGLERLSPLKVFAACLALGGVAIMFRGELSRDIPLAALLAIQAASVCASLASVMLKRGPRQDPIGANAVACWVGLAICLSGSWLTGEPHPWLTGGAALFSIAYLTLAGSIGAFVVFAWLVNYWPITRISFIAVVVPIVATTLGVIVRHERVTPWGLTGTACVLAAVALSIWSDRFRTTH